MVTKISTLYPVKNLNEQAFWETTDPHHNGKSSSMNSSFSNLITEEPTFCEFISKILATQHIAMCLLNFFPLYTACVVTCLIN